LNEKNRNLVVRVVSAAVLLPGVLFLLLKGGLYSSALMGAAGAICTAEYYAITHRERSAVVIVGVVAAFAAPLVPLFEPRHAGDWVFWGLGVFFVFAWAYYLFRGRLADAPVSVAHAITGLLFSAFGMTALSLLRIRPDGWSWVLCALIVTWGNDTCAYFVGRLFGHRKLYPEVSPNKTWEGFAGGFVGSLVGMFVARGTFFPALSVPDCLWVGAIGGIVGPIGDLSESMLKRAYQVKDSGKLIPGHGGLLDRLDALLFNTPLIFLYANFLRGNP